jgi:hypothetical protein
MRASSSSIFPCVYPPVHMSIRLFVYLSVCPSRQWIIVDSVCLSICLSIRPSDRAPLRPSARLSFRPSVFLSACLFVSVCLPVWLADCVGAAAGGHAGERTARGRTGGRGGGPVARVRRQVARAALAGLGRQARCTTKTNRTGWPQLGMHDRTFGLALLAFARERWVRRDRTLLDFARKDPDIGVRPSGSASVRRFACTGAARVSVRLCAAAAPARRIGQDLWTLASTCLALWVCLSVCLSVCLKERESGPVGQSVCLKEAGYREVQRVAVPPALLFMLDRF